MKITLKDKLNIFNGVPEVELEKGLTIITGCNGAGKTTLVHEIVDYIKENDIPHSYLDCNEEFHFRDIDDIGRNFNTMNAIQKGWVSEHEHYENMFGDWCKTIRPPDSFKGKTYAVVIDGLDSGGDVVFYALHTRLFDLMVKDALGRGIDFYLVVTCNNFYYLSHSKVGKALYIPTFESKPLPAYSSTEFENYIQDIRRMAKARGFDL